MIGGDLLRLLERLFRCLLEPEPAEREGLARADLALADVDDFEAAAAEIAGDAVGIVDARDDAESGQARFLGTGEKLHLDAGDGLDRGDELAAVRGLARRRCRQHVERLDVHLRRQCAEATDRGQSGGDGFGLEPAARLEAARKPAQLLLVEERRRRARQPLVDDETDGIGADVDDGDRPAAIGEPARRLVERAGLRTVGHASGEAWANQS
jgi:hypothetical protein